MEMSRKGKIVPGFLFLQFFVPTLRSVNIVIIFIYEYERRSYESRICMYTFFARSRVNLMRAVGIELLRLL